MLGWYSIDGYFFLVCEVLVLLTYRTSLDIVGYPLIHIQPPVSFFGFADGLVPTRMAGSGMVVH